MAQKPTSLAAQLKRDDEATKLAEAKEDLKIQGKRASPGKVWVRLVRPHYDAEGTLHEIGIAEIFADAIPSSAKVLSAVEAAEALEAEEADDE